MNIISPPHRKWHAGLSGDRPRDIQVRDESHDWMPFAVYVREVFEHERPPTDAEAVAIFRIFLRGADANGQLTRIAVTPYPAPLSLGEVEIRADGHYFLILPSEGEEATA
jgi:hypothetical protein